MKNQECAFPGMLYGALCGSMLENMLTGKCVARSGKVIVKAGKGV